MSRHGNRDNFRDYEEGDHLEWNISRWWAQNLGQLLEYSRLESPFTTSALSVLLSPQPVWLFIASHLLHQLTLFHTRHLVPLILIAWCSWEIKDLYFIWPFCLLTESKPVTNAAILRFELFTGLSLWGPLGPGRVTLSGAVTRIVASAIIRCDRCDSEEWLFVDRRPQEEDLRRRTQKDYYTFYFKRIYLPGLILHDRGGFLLCAGSEGDWVSTVTRSRKPTTGQAAVHSFSPLRTRLQRRRQKQWVVFCFPFYLPINAKL